MLSLRCILRIMLAAGICLALYSPPVGVTAQLKESDALYPARIDPAQNIRDRQAEVLPTDPNHPNPEAGKRLHESPRQSDEKALPEIVGPTPAESAEADGWVVRFSHERHAKQGCLICHQGTSADPKGPIKVEACFECHDEAITSGRCRDCHGKDRFLPTNHKPVGKWRKRHGYRANVVVLPDRASWNRVKTGHVYDCNACHRDDQCRKCHQFNRPDSHTGFWRIRGHGIRGLAERESCSVCHVEMFCVRCHKTTRPINHVGNWNTLHGRAVTQSTAERCWVCHPTVITRVRVGAITECNYCHPQ